ncbi:2-dehydropantoate 2-reductase [Virgibacillus profundi]|uniref:2-dehydropantoate 2-reductase n=1 Tax=Virgibacillus profundi TaxID=2024555 RepID=A0A2A2ICN9_9BACI|nr:ketopantoate reductase family protein [Virgibacillus profundi]PAV28843.1 2-dehydropantoate 2-reductase [Virgibacillus profundi]PXY53011.1 ketopantoate reductase family protein [Virgibacillus profundi]
MEIKNVSIIGLGALGILYGHHLSKQIPKENLRIIADKERIEKYTKEGIYCNGERCNFQFVTPEESVESADLIIFAVKYNGLQDAIKAVENHIGDNTIFLSTLNGISSEEKIGTYYGFDKIIYCVAQGMDAVKEDNQQTYDNFGILCFGEKEGIDTPKVKRIADFFKKVEMPFELDVNMIKRQWGKFMLNVGVNQTVAVFESDYGEIQKEGKAREMMISAMQEVLDLSKYEGINLTEADLQYWLDIVDKLGLCGKPSMRQDMEAKRMSELELFAGTVVELGKKHGARTSVNRELYRRISEMEQAF